MKQEGPIVDASHLKDALRKLGAKGAKQALKTFSESMRRIFRNKALGKAPVRTGVLKSSLKVKFKFNDAGHIRALVTAGGRIFDKGRQRRLGHKGAFYAGMQEYGFTDRGGEEHEGVYYLAQALEAVAPMIEENLVKELEAEIQRLKNV